MTTDNISKFKYINVLIQVELKQGITNSLEEHLRFGNASKIEQETWEMLADFLASGCKRPNKRPPTGMSNEIRLRNYEIKQEYNRLMADMKQREVLDKLAQKHNLGVDTIRGIVTRRD